MDDKQKLALAVMRQNVTEEIFTKDLPHTRAYISALEGHMLTVSSQKSYLEGKVSIYEEYLDSEKNRGRNSLRTEIPGEVPLMNLGDSLTHGGTSASDDDGLFSGKDLNDPPGALRTKPIEVDGEPQSIIDTSRVESGKLFRSGDVKEARGGHDDSPSADQITAEKIERIRLDLERQFADEYAVALKALEGNEFRGLVDRWERWRVHAIREFSTRLLRENAV